MGRFVRVGSRYFLFRDKLHGIQRGIPMRWVIDMSTADGWENMPQRWDESAGGEGGNGIGLCFIQPSS